ncbi:MAG TPA: diacylglycerol kinase family lipid kinase [Candidatus Cloacimonetes bacterium]|nr:diacylglycerol kinase family lipid kinase [Candidatus Cloacimonadota bacterium]HEX37709.1 diacylglycerol kinase family lipid kinase [Candidatus Cloacimonadota bacterium]
MYKIILNPFAGKGKAFKQVRKIEELFLNNNMPYELVLTDCSRQAIDFAHEAVVRGYEYIIAAGGDGTINEVVNGIMRSGYPENVKLGIIPIGGGNDFSKNIPYSKKLKENIQVIQKGHTRLVDIGQVENYYFINTLGVGFDAQVAISYTKNKWLNGFPGYLYAVLKALVHKKSYNVKLSINGDTFEQNALLISVGNGICCGGQFYLTPNACIDDGEFDFCVVDKLSRREIIKFIPRGIKGTHTSLPVVHIYRGKMITITSDNELPLYLDGEIPILADSLHIHVELLTKTIQLIVP